jgi:monothiol glutaredoxin
MSTRGVGRPAGTTPRVDIAPEAAEIMRGAASQREDAVVHLRIDAGWQHSLNLAPLSGQELRTTVAGVDLYMDPWTAGRADGLAIALEQSLQGTRFRFDNPNAPPPVGQMSVRTLKEKLDAGEPLELIDVRGPDERAKAVIDGARPWNEETDRRLEGLPKDTLIVCHCHRGGRSQQVAEYLRRKGFTNMHNLTGGIDAWSQEIDPQVPRY